VGMGILSDPPSTDQTIALGSGSDRSAASRQKRSEWELAEIALRPAGPDDLVNAASLIGEKRIRRQPCEEIKPDNQHASFAA
jgi:hypothetical protein